MIIGVLSGQLVPTKAEPPKRFAAEDAGNQNDGSSTSDWRAPHGLHEPPPLGHII